MPAKRVIKRYTNRKLYDKQESRYVTLEEIARLVREGEDVGVIDNETEEDLTAVTFAQIILEEEKRKLIRTGEARVQDFSEAIGDLTEKAGERVREVMEGGGKAIGDSLSFLDEILELPQKRIEAMRERAKRSVERLSMSPVVRRELDRIVQSLRTLEEAIGRINEEGKRQEREAEGEKAETEKNGFATPAGTISGSHPDDSNEPFSEPGDRRTDEG